MGLLVAILICLGLAKAVLAYLIWHENTRVVQLQQQEQISEQSEAKATAYRAQIQTAEQQLAALNALRGQNRIKILLNAIEAAYSEQIWLDEIRFLPRNTGATSTLNDLPGSAHANLIVVPEGAENASANQQGVEIIGHAVNHSLLAEFMRQLGQQPGVANMRLMDTGLRTYTTMQVVDFKLSLHIDQNSQQKTQGQR